jgi:hypothetical protein
MQGSDHPMYSPPCMACNAVSRTLDFTDAESIEICQVACTVPALEEGVE